MVESAAEKTNKQTAKLRPERDGKVPMHEVRTSNRLTKEN
jgi:hypothetical protein